MSGLRDMIARFARGEGGAVLVEFGAVIVVFLMMLFGLIDMMRLGFTMVMADKATERAVRMAVVMPPACPDLPDYNARGSNTDVEWGTDCGAGPDICADAGSFDCVGEPNGPTSSEIWEAVAELMPEGAGVENLRFVYQFDPAMGFVGGPFTPVVTVEITGLDFTFISPLGALGAAVSGQPGPGHTGLGFAFPAMSASLPAENLL